MSSTVHFVRSSFKSSNAGVIRPNVVSEDLYLLVSKFKDFSQEGNLESSLKKDKLDQISK